MKVTKFLYAIHAPSVGRVRIGSSVNPQDRLKTLQAASPVELKLVGCKEGSAQDVRDIQERYSSLREIGEWFHESLLKKLDFDDPPSVDEKVQELEIDLPRQHEKRQRLIKKAHTWHKLTGEVPKASDWMNVKSMRRHSPDKNRWPSYQTCIRAFGSWDDFITECGWEPRGRGQPI